MNFLEKHKIVSAELNDEGKLEVVRQFPSNCTYASTMAGAVPDKVTKETYGVVGGEIVLLGTEQGKHTPAQVVGEMITFY